MLDFSFIFGTGLALLALGVAGIAASRHFIVIMLAIELILVASMIMVVSFFSYMPSPNAGGLVLLISIWAVAAVEIIALVAFYVHMKQKKFDFDVTKLSEMKG